MNIAPLADRVVVESMKKEEKRTASGIIIPDAEDDQTQKGKVLAVGPGKRMENGKVYPVSVKKGDIVVFSKDSSTKKIRLNDRDVLFIYESDILTILQKERS